VYFFYEAYDPEGTTGKRIVDGCKVLSFTNLLNLPAIIMP